MSYVQTYAFSTFRTKDPTKRIVRSEAEFCQVIRYLKQFPTIAYDCETSGTAWYQHAEICGVAFAVWSPESPNVPLSWYMPCRHRTGEPQLPPSLVMQGLKLLLEDPNIEKVCHNIKFERHMAHREGITFQGPLRDTMIEAYLYNENERIGLKHRALIDLGDDTPQKAEHLLGEVLSQRAREAKLGKKEYTNLAGYSQIPIDLCGYYACYDVDATLRLAKFYDQKQVRQFFHGIYTTEIALTEVLAEMERNGLPIDEEYLLNLKVQTTQAMEEIAPRVYATTGEFNIASDAELRAVLLKMGAHLTKTTAGKLFAVDKEVLEGLTPQLPVCSTILEYRQASKLASTYTDSILQRLDKDNTLHGDFKQLGTTTGRLSSEKPNLQNFAGDSDSRAIVYSGKKLEHGGVDPWSVKRAFVNRAEGWQRCYFDYCLHPSTRVQIVGDYPKSIADVRPGDHVWGWADGKVVDAKVTKSETIQPLPAYRVTFSNGATYVASSDHNWPSPPPYKGAEPQKTKTEFLLKGMSVLTCKGTTTVQLIEPVGEMPMHAITTTTGNYALAGDVITCNSQIELRVLAQYSQDPTMIDVYAKGEDIHKRTSMEVFGSAEKSFRRLSKVINFGLSYMLGAPGLARQAKIHLEDAERHMANFFVKYPRIEPFRAEFFGQVRENNCQFTNIFGRPRRVPELASRDKWERLRAERQAIGSLIQGTAAELTKISLVRIHEWEKQNRTGLKLCSTIHDEISLDVKQDIAVEVGREVKRMMEDFHPQFSLVPIETDSETSDTNWSEKRKFDLKGTP